ncbi:MAG: hypothetical protein WAT71_11950 [Ignavibacteria bacterium]
MLLIIKAKYPLNSNLYTGNTLLGIIKYLSENEANNSDLGPFGNIE